MFSILVLIMTTAGVALSEQPVYFAETNLKAAVEKALGVSEPNSEDMLGLTELNASSKGIVELAGLEYATNLIHLKLYSNRISDILALSNLKNLKTLLLHNNQISNISAVSGLANLTELFFGW